MWILCRYEDEAYIIIISFIFYWTCTLHGLVNLISIIWLAVGRSYLFNGMKMRTLIQWGPVASVNSVRNWRGFFSCIILRHSLKSVQSNHPNYSINDVSLQHFCCCVDVIETHEFLKIYSAALLLAVCVHVKCIYVYEYGKQHRMRTCTTPCAVHGRMCASNFGHTWDAIKMCVFVCRVCLFD